MGWAQEDILMEMFSMDLPGLGTDGMLREFVPHGFLCTCRVLGTGEHL